MHNKTHLTHKCKICDKEEKNGYYLKQHITKVHAGTGITCDTCDFTARTIYLIKKHAKDVHSVTTVHGKHPD